MTTPPKAILFGAIGTLVETSDMQRRSFNAAFEDAGLDWEWGREDYARLLRTPGGARRIEDYARDKGQEVDAALIHEAKVAHFRARALAEGLELRPGVEAVVACARAEGVALGFATSTGAETVDLLFEGLGEALREEAFAFIGNRGLVAHSKPDPEIYQVALSQLGLSPDEAIAIEDTPESAEAALAAGVACVGFVGAEAIGRRFPAEVRVVERLEPAFFGLGRAG
ncbi:HAD-IA family hydrolase [Gymnodinialimonas sp.]